MHARAEVAMEQLVYIHTPCGITAKHQQRDTHTTTTSYPPSAKRQLAHIVGIIIGHPTSSSTHRGSAGSALYPPHYY